MVEVEDSWKKYGSYGIILQVFSGITVDNDIQSIVTWAGKRLGIEVGSRPVLCIRIRPDPKLFAS